MTFDKESRPARSVPPGRNGRSAVHALAVLFFLLLTGTSLSAAETLQILITDADTGSPAAGVSVYLLGNRTGGITDASGRCRLEASRAGNDSLRCRALGYREKTVSAPIPGTVRVRLQSELPVLETIEVSAARPDSVPPHERTSASVNVITRKDIPDRAASVEQVLDGEAGIDIRSLGGAGSRTEISIRGSSTDQVSVYVDGIPLSAGGSGFNGLAMAPMGRVDRIEVYRGSSPGAFGSGAIGGVIDISTAPANHAVGVESSLSYGSFGVMHQGLTGRFGSNRNRFLLGAGRNAGKNDFPYYDDRGTTIDTGDDGWEDRKNSDFESVYALGRWDGDWNEDHAFSVKVSGTDSERGVSGLGRKPVFHARTASQGILTQIRHQFRNLADTHLWLMRENVRFRDPMDEAGKRGRQDTESVIEVRGLTTRLKRITGPAILHASAELSREGFRSSDAYETAVTSPSRRITAGLGLEAEFMFREGTLWICPRVHAARTDDRIRQSSLFLAQTTIDSTLSLDRTTVTYALGARYRPVPALTVRANAGVFPRLPKFEELFGDTGDVVGNTRLEAERGANLDAGFHYTGGDGIMDADASIFYRFAEDLIQRRNYGDYLISENIGKAKIAGAECWSNFRTRENRASLRLTLAYQDARNRSDETLLRRQRYYGKFLPYHPEWKGSARASFRPVPALTVTWRSDGESMCYKGPSNLPEETLDAKMLHTLSLRWETRRSLAVVMEAENITDVRAPDRWGYPKPGRGFYLTLSWNWEREESERGN